MLTIRREQITSMSRAMATEFDVRAMLHLRDAFPATCHLLGEDGVRASIQAGFAKAAHYGLEAETDIIKFLNLMYAFGFEFDLDPALPWASEILLNEDYQPAEKIHLLTEHALALAELREA